LIGAVPRSVPLSSLARARTCSTASVGHVDCALRIAFPALDDASSLPRVRLSVGFAELAQLPRVRRLLLLAPVGAARVHGVTALLDPAGLAGVEAVPAPLAHVTPFVRARLDHEAGVPSVRGRGQRQSAAAARPGPQSASEAQP